VTPPLEAAAGYPVRGLVRGRRVFYASSMEIADKVIVVTGGAQGIGRAMCERFAREGARGICVADLDESAGQSVAAAVGGLFVRCDVADEGQIRALVEAAERRFGPIDLFCSNAGIGVRDAGGSAAGASNADWTRIWEINVMAHVYAARALLPGMIARGFGYLLNTASAAGLLSQIGSAPYSVTKHAAVAFAESLAITHGDQGIRVSVLCPQGVWTNMTRGQGETPQANDGMLQPEDVAQSVCEGLAAERFLILPHPQVLEYMQRKTADYDRWLAGMRRFRRKFV
jgi:NAD(P)-dependent dehydrogenase (short-subunit alcohol dehydrogenase family)